MLCSLLVGVDACRCYMLQLRRSKHVQWLELSIRAELVLNIVISTGCLMVSEATLRTVATHLFTNQTTLLIKLTYAVPFVTVLD